jgi:hypothetical protein
LGRRHAEQRSHRHPCALRLRSRARVAVLAGVGLLVGPVAAEAQLSDPRPALRAGWMDAGQALRGLRLVATVPRSKEFATAVLADSLDAVLALANSDLAFQGQYLFQGSYNGFQVWDISSPRRPTLRTALVCPGGQGDVSIYGGLLFVSVEDTRARVDCGTQGVADTVSPARMRGIRIFDIHDLDHPRQVAVVQTCRGSHTNTVVPDPSDPGVIYIYVSEIAVARSPSELAGCSRRSPAEDPHSSLFSIDIVRVPLASPESARIVSAPRLFVDSAANVAGLWNGGRHGPGTQVTAQTNACHDITAFPPLGIAAGACQGNGLLLDIHDPVHPKRLTEVSDPNFAYWHSATFSNDGSKVVFTDEWGGGLQPHCRDSDPGMWGADAIFTVSNGRLAEVGYYKLPTGESPLKNCTAHNGSLIPVPGRDILAQAWFQGGISIVDFTNPGHPIEIAFFDRGALDSTKLKFGGQWAGYWYNGHLYGSEINRGLDVLTLEPSVFLTRNEIEAAESVRMDRFNPQSQPRFMWPPSFAVVRAYLDQMARTGGMRAPARSRIAGILTRAETLHGAQRQRALMGAAQDLDSELAHAADTARVRAAAAVVREMARKS